MFVYPHIGQEMRRDGHKRGLDASRSSTGSSEALGGRTPQDDRPRGVVGRRAGQRRDRRGDVLKRRAGEEHAGRDREVPRPARRADHDRCSWCWWPGCRGWTAGSAWTGSRPGTAGSASPCSGSVLLHPTFIMLGYARVRQPSGDSGVYEPGRDDALAARHVCRRHRRADRGPVDPVRPAPAGVRDLAHGSPAGCTSPSSSR